MPDDRVRFAVGRFLLMAEWFWGHFDSSSTPVRRGFSGSAPVSWSRP
jgi:hypothetical protein